jgi:hypothetical protein
VTDFNQSGIASRVVSDEAALATAVNSQSRIDNPNPRWMGGSSCDMCSSCQFRLCCALCSWFCTCQACIISQRMPDFSAHACPRVQAPEVISKWKDTGVLQAIPAAGRASPACRCLSCRMALLGRALWPPGSADLHVWPACLAVFFLLLPLQTSTHLAL